MAGQDLRALFSTNDRELAAQEAFTNRQAQWGAVSAALAEHLQRIGGFAAVTHHADDRRQHVEALSRVVKKWFSCFESLSTNG